MQIQVCEDEGEGRETRKAGGNTKWCVIRLGHTRATKGQSGLLSRYVHLPLPFP